ncbi:MAG TPA: hypothetical protein VL424_15365 [Pararobbsia sp.]|jgi:Tfp pilus assembly PilM family ATPase|nr:hypothetical protein [Pararobbsia sp.]
MHNWVNGPSRNYVAGLEIGVLHVRAVVLAYGRSTPHAPPWIRLIHAQTVPMPDGAVSGADILEPRSVARVLVDVFGGPDDISRWSGAHLAIGLPCSTVVIRSMPFAELTRRTYGPRIECGSRARRGGDYGLNRFEERVLTEAERIMGVDRDDLCLDWFRSVSFDGVEHATIVTTTRQHVESRVSTAALAGLRVSVIDGDAEAALRACRFWMHARHAADSTFVVIWNHASQTRTWCIHQHAVEMTLEGRAALEWQRIAPWARERGPRVAVVAGDAVSDGWGELSPGAIARYTGCVVDRFSLDVCFAGPDAQVLGDDDAAYVVALGLALRGTS